MYKYIHMYSVCVCIFLDLEKFHNFHKFPQLAG